MYSWCVIFFGLPSIRIRKKIFDDNRWQEFVLTKTVSSNKHFSMCIYLTRFSNHTVVNKLIKRINTSWFCIVANHCLWDWFDFCILDKNNWFFKTLLVYREHHKDCYTKSNSWINVFLKTIFNIAYLKIRIYLFVLKTYYHKLCLTPHLIKI